MESRGVSMHKEVVVDDFAGSNDPQKIQAAIDYAHINNVKTVYLTERDYIMTSGIQIKEGIKLKFSYGSRFVVYGNFKVIQMERNSSLDEAYIAIDDTTFNSSVIYLDGKYKYYNVWWKSLVKNLTIVNWSGSHKGIGLHLYSNGPNHAISFMDFENIKIVGMNTGVKLQAVKASSGFSYVNANRFNALSLDDCINNIQIIGSETIPFECSGNLFTNIQVQPTSATQQLFQINGQQNFFDGLVWDISTINSTASLVKLTNKSSLNSFNVRGIPQDRINNQGRKNVLNLLY